MKAACIPNRPATLDTSKLKTAALEHLRLDLRNRFEGLQLNEDASPEDEWRELKDAVAAVGTGILVKRLLWQSMRAWREFKVHQITGKANNQSTTSGSQRLLEGNCGRDREGGGLR